MPAWFVAPDDDHRAEQSARSAAPGARSQRVQPAAGVPPRLPFRSPVTPIEWLTADPAPARPEVFATPADVEVPEWSIRPPLEPSEAPNARYVAKRRSRVRLKARRVLDRLLRIRAVTVAILGVIVASLRAVVIFIPIYGASPAARWAKSTANLASSDTRTILSLLLICAVPVVPLVVVLLLLTYGGPRR